MMMINVQCDGCSKPIIGTDICRGRVVTISQEDNTQVDYELCKGCMLLMRGAFNPKLWPRNEFHLS